MVTTVILIISHSAIAACFGYVCYTAGRAKGFGEGYNHSQNKL